jgi:hypothetical protein
MYCALLQGDWIGLNGCWSDVKEKVCCRLQSEGVWQITAMKDRKRDVVFILKLWELRCPRRGPFYASWVEHVEVVWTLTVLCSLPADCLAWWQAAQNMPLFKFAMSLGVCVLFHCFSVNSRFLLTVFLTKILRILSFSMQIHNTSKKHVHYTSEYCCWN